MPCYKCHYYGIQDTFIHLTGGGGGGGGRGRCLAIDIIILEYSTSSVL